MNKTTVIIIIFCMVNNIIFAQNENKNHYTYFSSRGVDDFGDTFNKNSEYFRCESKNLCPVINNPNPARQNKRYAFFIRRESDSLIMPVFLQCYRDGSASVSMAEKLVPILNEVVQNGNTECLELEGKDLGIPKRFVEDTIDALENYDGNCPINEKNSFEQALDVLVMNDLKNVISIDSLTSVSNYVLGIQDENTGPTKTGCLGNIISSIVEMIRGIIGLFFDVGGYVKDRIVDAWNYFFGSEEDKSEAMMNASILPQDLSDALANWDFKTFYDLLRQKLFKFLGDIRDFYMEVIGCTEWAGYPYQSECLSKMNWSCPDTEHILQFTCGVMGEIGSNMLLGGVLGGAKAAATMASLRKSVALNPAKINIPAKAASEMSAKRTLTTLKDDIANGIGNTRYQLGRKFPGFSEFIENAGYEISLVSGIMGGAFRNATKFGMVTTPVHYSYQAGKQIGFKFTRGMQIKTGSEAIETAAKFAGNTAKIRNEFEKMSNLLFNMRGQAFDIKKYRELMRNYYQAITPQLREMGIQVSNRPRGAGLLLQKDGKKFVYLPNFADMIKSVPENTTRKDFLDSITRNDPFLTQSRIPDLPPSTPDFVRDIHAKSNSYNNLYTVESDSIDGYVYMNNFSRLVDDVGNEKDCNGHLSDSTLFSIQDITPQPEPKAEAPAEAATATDTPQE